MKGLLRYYLNIQRRY